MKRKASNRERNSALEVASDDPEIVGEIINSSESQKSIWDRKISILLVENLHLLPQIEDVNFKRFVSQLSQTPIDKIPTGVEVLYQINESFLNYQQYFSQFFCDHPDQTYCLTLHKWNNTCANIENQDAVVFFNLQYINDKFQFFGIPLGLFKLEDKGEINLGLIRNTILKDLTGKINFITCNFDLDYKTKNVIKFLLNDDFHVPESTLDSKCDDKILMCFPTLLLDNYSQLVSCIFPDSIADEWSKEYSAATRFEKLYKSALGSIKNKIEKMELSYIKTKRDFDNKKFFLRDLVSSNIIFKLRSVVLYKNSLTVEHKELLTDYQWQVAEFLGPLSATIYKLINGCKHPNGDSSEILKLIKYELFFLEQSYQHSLPKLNLLPPAFLKSFEQFSINLEKYHKCLSSKMNILLATYLCPYTKKFLKDSEIQLIRSVLERRNSKRSKTHEDQTPILSSDDTVNMMDGIIMDIFQCSGNLNGEILMYESIKPTSVPEDILQFWKQNQAKFPNLSRVAQKVLPLQINSENNFQSFQQNYRSLQHLSTCNNHICSTEAIYYMYKLSTEYDLLSIDPTNRELEKHHRRIYTQKEQLTTKDINLAV